MTFHPSQEVHAIYACIIILNHFNFSVIYHLSQIISQLFSTHFSRKLFSDDANYFPEISEEKMCFMIKC